MRNMSVATLSFATLAALMLGTACGGANSDEPVYPAGVAACVEGSKAMVDALNTEVTWATWDRDLAVKECGG